MAEQAIKNPLWLKGLTPTQTGQIREELASDPAMADAYNASISSSNQKRAQTVMRSLDKLVAMDPATGKGALTPGGKDIFGEWTPKIARGLMPGKAATDANASLRNVTGNQIIDWIADMKAQSSTGATGFGQLNLEELAILEAAASRLTQRVSEETALEDLMAIRSLMAKAAGGEQPSGNVTPGQQNNNAASGRPRASDLINKYGGGGGAR